jgi:hypothetical protein
MIPILFIYLAIACFVIEALKPLRKSPSRFLSINFFALGWAFVLAWFLATGQGWKL